MVLFPALAEEVFGKPQLLGLLYSAETVGALVATALSGWTGRVHHHGRAIVIAAAAYGGFVALAGLMPSIWLVGVFLALAGAADMISGVFRGTVWSQTIPEAMRGRLAGIEMLSYSLGPLGGQVRAGVTADLWSVRGAITSGGLACVAGVGAHRAVAARLLVLRRPHRRARRGRARRAPGGRRELSQPRDLSAAITRAPSAPAEVKVARDVELHPAATRSRRGRPPGP